MQATKKKGWEDQGTGIWYPPHNSLATSIYDLVGGIPPVLGTGDSTLSHMHTWVRGDGQEGQWLCPDKHRGLADHPRQGWGQRAERHLHGSRGGGGTVATGSGHCVSKGKDPGLAREGEGAGRGLRGRWGAGEGGSPAPACPPAAAHPAGKRWGRSCSAARPRIASLPGRAARAAAPAPEIGLGQEAGDGGGRCEGPPRLRGRRGRAGPLVAPRESDRDPGWGADLPAREEARRGRGADGRPEASAAGGRSGGCGCGHLPFKRGPERRGGPEPGGGTEVRLDHGPRPGRRNLDVSPAGEGRQGPACRDTPTQALARHPLPAPASASGQMPSWTRRALYLLCPRGAPRGPPPPCLAGLGSHCSPPRTLKRSLWKMPDLILCPSSHRPPPTLTFQLQFPHLLTSH